jgi:hypothetical protein
MAQESLIGGIVWQDLESILHLEKLQDALANNANDGCINWIE